jgi:conjugative relaxase-like TrwC/TraI family protein
MKVSIAKLAGNGVLDYLTQQVADDYYTAERGEAPGRWWGTGTAVLDLSGTVRRVQLERLLGGCDPRTGTPLLPETVRARPDRVTGFDITFSVPKEVSILAGLCGDVEHDGERVGTIVERAISESISVGLEYLSTRLQVRRGHAGEHRLDAAPVVARFPHRTSREGDPQWHQHCVVASVACGTDGRWSQLDFQALYRDAHAAASLAGATLRQRLTERLGVGWEWPADGALPRLAYLDPALTRTFSKRRAQINRYLDGRSDLNNGLSAVDEPTLAQRATLNTRGRKGLIDYAKLRDRWQTEAGQLGAEPDQIVRDVSGRLQHPFYTSARELLRVLETAAGPDGLCAMAASFDRTDVIRYLCDNTILDWRHTVALADAFCDTAVHRLSTRGVARYTTQTQRDLEARCIALARHGRSSGRPCSATAIAFAINNDEGLAAEQREAVRALAASDDLITVLIGPAGTGKTRLAATLRTAAEHDGMTIGGAALARRAARNLQDASGIPSTSVDAWCRRIATKGPTCLPDTLVIDEANMVDTRALVTLTTAAQRAGTRIMAMGDPQQLGAVGAGGGFLAWCRPSPLSNSPMSGGTPTASKSLHSGSGATATASVRSTPSTTSGGSRGMTLATTPSPRASPVGTMTAGGAARSCSRSPDLRSTTSTTTPENYCAVGANSAAATTRTAPAASLSATASAPAETPQPSTTATPAPSQQSARTDASTSGSTTASHRPTWSWSLRTSSGTSNTPTPPRSPSPKGSPTTTPTHSPATHSPKKPRTSCSPATASRAVFTTGSITNTTRRSRSAPNDKH